MNLSPTVARRKVTGFVVDEISTQMHGGEPTLEVGKRIYWRVPVWLSLPPVGDLGKVGSIDVGVDSGQLQITESLIQEIILSAAELANHNQP